MHDALQDLSKGDVMKVGDLIQAAFRQASIRNPDLHAAWVTASYRLGGLLPTSTLVSSVQRAGELDQLVRCMEDEFSFNQDGQKPSQEPDFSFHYQVMLSELWITEMYEIFRLLKDRKLAPSDNEFDSLAHHLRLLRISIDKHEIAGDRKLEVPLMMKRYPPKDDDSDIYHYSKDRSGPICLNSSPRFLSGFSADSHAASLPVGSITAYASSGVCLPRLECGLDWLYQLRYCVIDVLASVTES
jgi:hypothetical protein